MTSPSTDLACRSSPLVTPFKAVALTAELSVKAVERPTKVSADFAESFESDSSREAMFSKFSFCASTV